MELPEIQDGDVVTGYPEAAATARVGRIGAQAWNGMAAVDRGRVLRVERNGKVIYERPQP